MHNNQKQSLTSCQPVFYSAKANNSINDKYFGAVEHHFTINALLFLEKEKVMKMKTS